MDTTLLYQTRLYPDTPSPGIQLMLSRIDSAHLVDALLSLPTPDAKRYRSPFVLGLCSHPFGHPIRAHPTVHTLSVHTPLCTSLCSTLCTPHRLETLFENHDRDRDGVISFAEFAHLMESIASQQGAPSRDD